MNKIAQLQTQAIQAAKVQDWSKALEINQQILEEKPEDTATLNRTGVAYLQLGKKRKAVGFFQQAIKFDKTNQIARRFLDKLKNNQNIKLPSFCSQEFIEEPGKTKNALLHRLAGKNVLDTLNVGQACELKTKSRYISVEVDGQYLGALPEDLSFRLTKLIKNGNTYSCRIRSIKDKSCMVFLKETYQSQKNVHVHSFSVAGNSKSGSGDLSQIDDSLLRQEDIPINIINSDDDDTGAGDNPHSLVELSEKSDQLN